MLMALAQTVGGSLLQSQNTNSQQQQQQGNTYLKNPPWLCWASSETSQSTSFLTSGTSSAEICRCKSPLTFLAFDGHAACDCSVDDVYSADIRTRIAHDDDDYGSTACSSLTDDGMHILHDDAPTCLDGNRNGPDMFHGNVDDNVYLKAQKQQKASRLPSHVYPHGQSSCHENHLLQSLCNDGHLDRAMDALFHMHTSPSTDAYLSLLRLCHKTKSLTHVKDVCAHLVRHQSELNGYLGDFLVMTLANCGAVEDAQDIASRLVCRTVFSWTAIISAYVNRGQELEALRLYECMQKEGVEPDIFTFVSLLKACASLQDLARGKSIHTDACKKGLAAEIFVGNSLVSMYGKCGATFEAENTFMALSHRDIVSWTAMLSAYLEEGQSKKALQVFRQMYEEAMNPNHLTCVIALQACVSFAGTEEAALGFEGGFIKVVSLEIGQALHAYARRKDLVSDSFVNTTLLNMYGNCGSISMAENVFSMLPYKCKVSWNAMLAAYVDQSHGREALLLFKQMLEEGMSPDRFAYASVIQACSIIVEKEAAIVVDGCSNKVIALKIGHALHADVRMINLESDAFISSALVTMYGKCGSIEGAEAVFNDMSNHDLVSWSALFSAYIEHGQGENAMRVHREMQKEGFVLDDVALMLAWTAMLSGFVAQGQGGRALELHRQMQEEGVMLDDVALNYVLQACCLTGSLESCREVHFTMVCSGYDSSHTVAATLIHAYGECARMVDAQVIFDMLPEPNIVSWNMCIAGYAGKGDVVACMHMFEELTEAEIKPDNSTFSYVLSVCCHAGLVARGLEIFESMSKDFGVAPDLKHYGIIIDLLGRAGDFDRIRKMLDSMPLQPDLTIWMCLLGACQTHGNVDLAKLAFKCAVNLQPKEEAAYVVMSNIYAEAGMQECAANIGISRQKACA